MKKQRTLCTRRNFLLGASTIVMGALLDGYPLPLCRANAQSLALRPQRTPDTPRPPTISIIIDDVGYNPARVRPFFSLRFPITFSILPHLPYSAGLAETIRAEGHEVMLHQPMQPRNSSINPGPGALFLAYDAREVVSIVRQNIKSLPYAIGANNHMGSCFTESRPKVAEVLKVFKDRQLFFIDSVTSRHSVAYETACRLDMSTAFRNIFIDNIWEEKAIRRQLKRLKRHALRYGHAIGIGHPRPETVRALEDFLKDIDASPISLTYASTIVSSVHPSLVRAG